MVDVYIHFHKNISKIMLSCIPWKIEIGSAKQMQMVINTTDYFLQTIAIVATKLQHGNISIHWAGHVQ
jgi:hypothetical protein